MENQLKITSIKIKNFMQIDLAEIDLNNTITVIGGENESGKTSVIKALASVLGGKICMPPKPLREGKSRGEIVVELNNGFNLIRTFQSNGTSTFTIVNEEGEPAPSPQKLIDGLKGEFTIDPLAFMDLKGEKKTAMVKKLAGLDFTELDEEYKTIFIDRTRVNNRVEVFLNQYTGIPFDKDAPEAVSISELTDELERLRGINQLNATDRKVLLDSQKDVSDANDKVLGCKMALDEAEADLVRVTEVEHRLSDRISNLKDEDTEDIQFKIATAEETNAVVRSNKEHLEKKAAWKVENAESDRLTDKLEAIKDKKRKMLEKAKLPVKGLSFDGDVLMYKNIPFEQCSGEVQLRISTAMGFAENPELKTILIDEGSRIDRNRLKLLAEMAEEQNGQIIMTRVDSGKETDYVMTYNTAVPFVKCPACKGKGCDKCSMIGKIESPEVESE